MAALLMVGAALHCLRGPAGQRGRLLHPLRHLCLVDLVVLVDVNPAHLLALRRGTSGDWSQRRAAEEGYLDVAGKDVKRQEPTPALDAVKWRVPFDGLTHAGDGAHDERIEVLPDVSLPARHRCDVRLHRSVAVRLCDLRVAARQEDNFLVFSHLSWLDPARIWLGFLSR